MRIRPPSSRARGRFGFPVFDWCVAAATPPLALYLRDAYVLSGEWTGLAAGYCLVSLAATVAALAAFGAHRAIPRYYSAHDVIGILKAVLAAELVSCLALFTITRLEGIPRSTPLVHALLLAGGLIAGRGIAVLAARKRGDADRGPGELAENIVLIGLSELAVRYLQFVKAAGCQRIVAVLDGEPRWLGRTVVGVPVFGPPGQLESLLDELAVHGVEANRVILGAGIAGEAGMHVRRICGARGLDLLSLPDILGAASRTAAANAADAAEVPDRIQAQTAVITLPAYFRAKRGADCAVGLLLALLLLPLAALAAAASLLDLGLPILFWQQRIGVNGRHFLLYKIRTLRPPHSPAAEPQPSWVGRWLRATRLDELPQLLNVIAGDMSLVGPRPLLPRDQPPAPSVRLRVRPGLTGWAQVNGGQLLSPSEKDELDEWYIRNASLRLDLLILGLTIRTLWRGDRRSEQALAAARAPQRGADERAMPAIGRPLPSIP